MKALLLIDIQNDFLPGGALAVPQGDHIIPVVNKLQHRFDLVVATQDWHPGQHKSFASSHHDKTPFDQIELNGLTQVLWPDHCVQGTTGAQLSTAVNWNLTETIFRKGTDPEIDSYSGFYDNGRKKSTGLADYLKGRNIKELYIAGLAGDYCVAFSAKDALLEGFSTYIIEDATKPISETGYHEKKIELITLGGRFITSEHLV